MGLPRAQLARMVAQHTTGWRTGGPVAGGYQAVPASVLADGYTTASHVICECTCEVSFIALCKQGGKGSRICLFKDRQSYHPEESATGCSLVVNIKLFLCAVSHISDAVQIITDIGLCP